MKIDVQSILVTFFYIVSGCARTASISLQTVHACLGVERPILRQRVSERNVVSASDVGKVCLNIE